MCPRCNGRANLLEGLYSSLGNTIRVLTTSHHSALELEALRHALKTARDLKASREEIQDTIKAHAPELKDFADTLPHTRSELYQVLQLLVMILTALIGAYAVLQKTGPTEAEIKAMVGKAVAEACQQPPASPSAPAPRNRAERRARGRPARPK